MGRARAIARSRSPGETPGKSQYIIPMPDGNQIRKTRHSATPSQRCTKIADALEPDGESRTGPHCAGASCRLDCALRTAPQAPEEFLKLYVYNEFTVRGTWLPYRVQDNHLHDLERCIWC